MIDCCPNCESERSECPIFFWKPAKIYKEGTTKEQGEYVAICCAQCGRTITVIPKPSNFE